MRVTLQPKRAVLAGIRFYQLTLSPWLGRQCRFYPTCSHYALEAVETHGVRKGGLLALCRLGRCHPFHDGGVDLVPPVLPAAHVVPVRGAREAVRETREAVRETREAVRETREVVREKEC